MIVFSVLATITSTSTALRDTVRCRTSWAVGNNTGSDRLVSSKASAFHTPDFDVPRHSDVHVSLLSPLKETVPPHSLSTPSAFRPTVVPELDRSPANLLHFSKPTSTESLRHLPLIPQKISLSLSLFLRARKHHFLQDLLT